jgi:hypothetical protein
MTWWTERRVQFALTYTGNLFDCRRYSVVPNVSWGLLKRGEEDLICLSKAGVFHAVEIKVSLTDMKADLAKRHQHLDKLVAFNWYAFPKDLDGVVELVPPRFGVVVVGRRQARDGTPSDSMFTQVIRRPTRNPDASKPTDKDVNQFLRLGVMRMWARRERMMEMQQ